MYSIVLMAAITSGAEVADRHGCCGCYGGGGYARGCHGCYGGCYGGWGGCYGGWGGCYGGYTGWGCYGGGYGCGGYGCGGGYYGGCYGGYGCGGYYASVSPYYPTATYTQGTYAPVTTVASTSAPATLVVNLPADARLTVDGTPTQATSARRVFTTPPLEQGKEFYYTLRAEVMRDGQPVQTTQQVTVRAGLESSISIQLPAATVASR